MNLREWWEGREPRERTLAMIMGALMGAAVLLGAPLYAAAKEMTLTEQRDALQAAIDELTEAAPAFHKQQQREGEILARYQRRAPDLAGLLERYAKDAGLAIPESVDQPEVPHGKGFSERAIKVTLRKVAGAPLALFLENIATAGFPLSVSRLLIRKHGTDIDSFDVELTVSAFDRVEPAPPKRKAPSGAAAPTPTDEVSP